ncbi:MAG: hypothetical protein HQM08_04955 [Candidatus Riflebacteria bacterium]|nr:hypothetical protein [Candidatus Riflebacteria bacterium]
MLNRFQKRVFQNIPRANKKRGFVFFVAVAIIPIILLLVFSYNGFVREEALRIHRLYWNDLVTKVAEGTAQEAFAWFMANPDPSVNEILAFLIDQNNISSGHEKKIDILGKLKFPLALDGPIIESCTLSATNVQNFFFPTGQETTQPSLPAGFSSVSQAVLYPDPGERFSLLKVEVVASFKKLRRKYEVVREIKTVNILPGIFGQFTLFVKDKNPGIDGDLNHLKSATCRTFAWAMDGFADNDPSNRLGNPLTVVNHPDDLRTAPMPGLSRVAPDWQGGILDVTKRGWLFFGSTITAGPFQAWMFHPFQGDLQLASQKTERFRFFGGNFMLSNHSTLIYHTKMPLIQTLNPKVPAADLNTSPFSDGDPGHPFIGWLIYMKRYGYFSGTQQAMDALGGGQLFRSYYQDPAKQDESTHGSLIFPFGSLFPESPNTVADQRSPSIVLGPTGVRFLQSGNIVQINGAMNNAISNGTDILDAYTSQMDETKKPKLAWIPFFPIKYSSIETSKDLIGWNTYSGVGWASVAEKGVGNLGAFPMRDWAAINWNIISDVLGGGITPPTVNYVNLTMCKPLVMHTIEAFDLITQNNMRSISNPAGFVSPNRTLTNLPETIQPVDDQGRDTSDDINGFFYGQMGRGECGNRFCLKEKNGRRLAVGYLGALWPFSTQNLLPGQPLIFSQYDFRQKSTHVASSPADFFSSFVKKEGNCSIIDLKDGIVTVLGGDVTLKEPGGYIFRNGGMLIVSDGNLILESRITPDANYEDSPLTFATAKDGKNIIFACPGPFHAYFISSGTVKRRGGAGVSIRGGLTVKYFDFSELDSESFFQGHPAASNDRSTVVWNPIFDAFNSSNQKKGNRYHLGPSIAFWKTNPG